MKEDEPILGETDHSFADALENGGLRPVTDFLLIRPAIMRRFCQNLPGLPSLELISDLTGG